MYCKKCGNQMEDNTKFCPTCGTSQCENASVVAQPVESKGSFGWCVLGFFFPLIGFILFLVWHKSDRKNGHMAGLGALIRIALKIVGTVLAFIIALIIGDPAIIVAMIYLFFFKIILLIG